MAGTAPSAPPPAYEQVGSYSSVPTHGPDKSYESPPYPVSQTPGMGYASFPNPQPPPVYPQQGYGQPPGTGYDQGYQPNPVPNSSVTYGHDDDHILGDNEMNTEWSGNSFSNKKIRQRFIMKVYFILMAQLFVTVAFVCFFMFCHPVRVWVQHNSWFYWCSYGVFLTTYITLVCCDSVRRRYPGNFICLIIFTLAFSYMAGTISSFYATESVLIAIGITAAVCLAISLFAIQTKIDFTMCSGMIFALSMTLIFFGFACMIVYLAIGPSRIMQCVYGGVAALIFSLFLVFDTQMVVGGQKRKYELSAEEYIFGALQLYLDVVYLFLLILSLVGGGRRD